MILHARSRGCRGKSMLHLEIIAEQKILEAIARGEFANLPGAGKPLRLEDDSMIPGELRIAYKVLKNAGCIPPELELRKEIITLRGLLRTIEDDGGKKDKYRELNYKLLKLNLIMRRTVTLDDFPEYKDRIERKLAGREAG
jgi:hypothetical protein